MKHLRNYVEGINRYAKIFGEGQDIDVNNLNEEMAQMIFNKIDCDLSPENLCCDGEISAAQVRKKAQMLRGAAADLKKLGYAHRNWCEI